MDFGRIDPPDWEFGDPNICRWMKVYYGPRESCSYCSSYASEFGPILWLSCAKVDKECPDWKYWIPGIISPGLRYSPVVAIASWLPDAYSKWLGYSRQWHLDLINPVPCYFFAQCSGTVLVQWISQHSGYVRHGIAFLIVLHPGLHHWGHLVIAEPA